MSIDKIHLSVYNTRSNREKDSYNVARYKK